MITLGVWNHFYHSKTTSKLGGFWDWDIRFILRWVLCVVSLFIVSIVFFTSLLATMQRKKVSERLRLSSHFHENCQTNTLSSCAVIYVIFIYIMICLFQNYQISDQNSRTLSGYDWTQFLQIIGLWEMMIPTYYYNITNLLSCAIWGMPK